MIIKKNIFSLYVLIVLSACSGDHENIERHQGASLPSEHTSDLNQSVLEQLPFEDLTDFEQAKKGLIAQPESLIVKDDSGKTIWDQTAYTFMSEAAPESANPSLWRQARLNNIHGLFKVTDGIFQLRGFDLANMSIIEGKTGWIIVDPLTTAETAREALSFARQHLGNKPVVAILFTHSHIDHFGGVLGVLESSQGEGMANDGVSVPIIAPEGFMEEATSENIIAGMAMGRRAMYMYGKRLPKTERGHIGSGLGKEPAMGSFGITPPTQLIKSTGQQLTIDGVRFEFQIVSGSEAPAEFTFYLPDFNAFCGAEMVSRNMHNLYTLRGAKVRDGLGWSNYIQQSMELFPDTEIYFGSHHWPIWGQEKIHHFMTQQRDTYKYIHDQSVRLMNAGYTSTEIAEELSLPASLANNFSNRGYYGTVSHNAKAVYQGYLGWYDGNPANLDNLPTASTAERYVSLMGGEDNVLEAAQDSFKSGDYRWAAELLNKLVFSDSENSEAKALLAKTYDQLGYQSESGPWRDVYLTAAFELRHGAPDKGVDIALMEDVLRHTPIHKFFDSMAVRLDGKAAEGENYIINITFSDLNESHILSIENAVLHHKKSAPAPNANASLTITHELFIQLSIGKVGVKELLFSDDITFEGSNLDLMSFFSLFDKPKGVFNIVTP